MRLTGKADYDDDDDDDDDRVKWTFPSIGGRGWWRKPVRET